MTMMKMPTVVTQKQSKSVLRKKALASHRHCLSCLLRTAFAIETLVTDDKDTYNGIDDDDDDDDT